MSNEICWDQLALSKHNYILYSNSVQGILPLPVLKARCTFLFLAIESWHRSNMTQVHMIAHTHRIM